MKFIQMKLWIEIILGSIFVDGLFSHVQWDVILWNYIK